MAQVIWNSDIDVYNKDVIPINIAKNIAKYLPIQDLLSFSQVSKNCHLAVTDPKLWVSMLKGMGVWQEAKQLTKQDIKSNQKSNTPGGYLNDPLTCMDYIYRSNKNAKYQVIKIYKCLHEFYNDLLIQQNYNRLKIFKRFQTPQDQVKILKNLQKFNKIDYIESSRIIANEKIIQLFELLENALLRELEIHFDIEDYEKTKQFKSIFDENIELFNLENYDETKYFITKEGTEPEKSINNENTDELIINIAKVFNQQSHIIDLIFPQSIPMMYKVSEELISNQLSELLMLLIESSKKFGLYSVLVPMIYEKLAMSLFIDNLNPCENVGESFHQLIIELIDMSFESFAAEYMREEVGSFKSNTKRKLLDWEQVISKREQETSQKILDRVKIETKNDFLTSFKNVFTINSSKNNVQEEVEVEAYSEIQAKAKILSENIKSLDKIFNPELTVEILNDCRISIHRLLKFQNFSIASVRQDIFQSIQHCFVELIELINSDHLLPGFDRALTYLQTYNPKSPTYTKSHNESFDQPLILFFNLINMADIIIQMIDIFYKQEILITQQNENSILNPSLQNKKKLEAIVDKYVADGLNIGIEILVDQVETIYQQNLSDKDYYPDFNIQQQNSQQQQQQQQQTDSQTIPKAAIKATEVLEQNMNLLVDSADKSIVDVFQQEIAERFFQIIVKSLKLKTISVMGATRLISDLNLYFKFINNNVKSNKRLVLPLYQALIKIGNIYLISGDDSKSIGKLVSDLSKFNGIFSQEEIYEFVQRRQDWPIIKKHVEKVMYGFGFGDCTIM
ncbi:Exocyst complex component Sec10 family protein [Candida albicans]|uniref:Exocyst complex component Sec10 family protein n=1 Tax=Candida albicans TaxID=5476 RepID=A0A8H6C0J0_CANAX|nr:Exocyst complex component Sec10 family protein [Candida albicans]